MDRLAQLIEETTDVRELKRAVGVKLGEKGSAPQLVGMKAGAIAVAGFVVVLPLMVVNVRRLQTREAS